MRRKSFRIALVISAIAAFITVSEWGSAQQSYPTRPIQLVPAGDPGGGLDIHARAIEQALTNEKMLDKPFLIQHKGSGGGNVMTSHLVTQKGNGYTLGINTNRVLINELLGTTEYGYKDLTPVARLTTEFHVWAVRADSKYKTALDVIADLRKDPTSVIFGNSSMPGNDQFNIFLPVRQKGVDFTRIKTVVFDSGGDAMAKLLGGHAPILCNALSEVIAQAEAGKVRILSVSSPSRLDRLPNVPTWKEMGIDVVIYHWRGIYGPPDMPKEAYEYWNKKFAAMVKTKTWKDLLAKFELYDAFLPGDEFKKQLEKDYETYRELLGSMGMLKKKQLK